MWAVSLFNPPEWHPTNQALILRRLEGIISLSNAEIICIFTSKKNGPDSDGMQRN